MTLSQGGVGSGDVLARGPATDGSEAFDIITTGGLWLTAAYLLVLLWLLDGYGQMTPGAHRDRRTRALWRAFRIWACGLLGASSITLCNAGLGWPFAVALLVGVSVVVAVGLALPMPGRRQRDDVGSGSLR